MKSFIAKELNNKKYSFTENDFLKPKDIKLQKRAIIEVFVEKYLDYYFKQYENTK
jgi:hypothetical protein